MHMYTHDPRTPAGRAALRLFASIERDTYMAPVHVDDLAALLDLADERDRLAALLREAREAVNIGAWFAQGNAAKRACANVLAHIDDALAKEPRQ